MFERLSKFSDISILQNRCFENHYMYPSIDFVNGYIKKCICSHNRSPKIKLTNDSFEMMCKEELSFDRNNLCDNCYHVIYNFNILIRE